MLLRVSPVRTGTSGSSMASLTLGIGEENERLNCDVAIQVPVQEIAQGSDVTLHIPVGLPSCSSAAKRKRLSRLRFWYQVSLCTK